MKKFLFFIIFLSLGFVLGPESSAEAGECRYYRHAPVYRYHRVAPRHYCPPPGHVYRHYHFAKRWYYYGPYCGPRVLPPVIVVPLPVMAPGYFVDVQCATCKRWWRWRPEYTGQIPQGLPPCWDYAEHEYVR
jgi:hypothetical protein